MNSQSQRQGQYAFWWPLIYCRGIETWRTTTRRRRVLLSYQGNSDRLRLILLYLKYHGLSHDIYCRGPWELGTLTSAKKERFEKVYSPCLLLFTTTGVMETVAFRSLFYCLISTPSRMKLFGTVLRTVPYHLGTDGISTVQHEKAQESFNTISFLKTHEANQQSLIQTKGRQ